jgi:hypothetical protein
MPLTVEDIQILKATYPWPQKRPDFRPEHWLLDGGGKDLILSRIGRGATFLILEIGSFLGSSIKIWLNASPNVYVIAIDPWEGEWWIEYAKTHGRHQLAEQFSWNNGPYLTFLSSLWDYQDRLFPVQGKSPDKLYELENLGIIPDLIYFDSDKTGVDIEIAHQLFPDALLTGDDWTWGIEQGYPIRVPVNEFCRNNGYKVIAKKATFILSKCPLKLSEHLCNTTSRLRDIARELKRILGP